MSGNENSLQFTDNNDLYFIAKNSADYNLNSVRAIRYQPDYCAKAEETISALWPVPPSPVIIVEDGSV